MVSSGSTCKADSETISIGDAQDIPVARTGLVVLHCQLHT